MEFRNRANGEIVTEKQFRLLHPNTSFPPVLTGDILDGFGFDPVFEGPVPTGGYPYGLPIRDGVEQVDGKWFTRYVMGPIFKDYTDENGSIVSASEQEVNYKVKKDKEQAQFVREERTQKLLNSDWTQLPDAPVNTASWAAYRQALRDISDQAGFPWEVAWPEEPA